MRQRRGRRYAGSLVVAVFSPSWVRRMLVALIGFLVALAVPAVASASIAKSPIRSADKMGRIEAWAKHPTKTKVNCDPPVVVVGVFTTCTATVTDTATGGKTTPTGTVSFTSSGPGSFSSASCNLSGVGASASCSVTYTPGSSPTPGGRSDTITGSYSGDATHSCSRGSTKVTVLSPSG